MPSCGVRLQTDGRVIVAAVASNLSRSSRLLTLQLRLAVEWSWQGLMWKTSSAQPFAWTISLLLMKTLIKPAEYRAARGSWIDHFGTGRDGQLINGLVQDVDLVVTAMWKSKMILSTRYNAIDCQRSSGSSRVETWSTKQVELSNWSRLACVSGHEHDLIHQLLNNSSAIRVIANYPCASSDGSRYLAWNIFIPKRGTVMEHEKGDFVPPAFQLEMSWSMGTPLVMWAHCPRIARSCLIVAITVNRKEKKIISKGAHPWFRLCQEESGYSSWKLWIGQPKRWRSFGTRQLWLGELKGLVRDNLFALFEQTKRRPAILPVVMEAGTEKNETLGGPRLGRVFLTVERGKSNGKAMQIEYYSEAFEDGVGRVRPYPDASRVEDPADTDIPVLISASDEWQPPLGWSGLIVERILRNTNLIVVPPNTNNGFYTDTQYGYNYYTAIAEELPETLSRFFLIWPRNGRKPFIAGLSMGGYGSMCLGSQDEFSPMRLVFPVLWVSNDRDFENNDLEQPAFGRGSLRDWGLDNQSLFARDCCQEVFR